MSIANYSELQTAIGSWLHRTDLATKIVDFITLAESRINRELNAREAETDLDLTTAVGNRAVALPSGFVKPISVHLRVNGDSHRYELDQILPEENYQDTSNNRPIYYAIDGANIVFDSPIDSTSHTITLRYQKAWDIANDTTNWLLTNHPDVYLYGGLVEAAIYLREERLGLWSQLYDKAVKDVRTKENQSRRRPLRMEIPVVGNRSYNITSDY